VLEALAAGDASTSCRRGGRPLMARLALALDPATEDRLLADVVEHGHTDRRALVGWRDVLESLDVLAPDVVLVGAARATLSAELLAGCDERGIRLIALAAGDADRANAAQLGLHEVLDRTAPWPEVDALVRGGVPVPSRLGDAEPRARRSAAVIAVWGPAGAPGRTTVAVNLAAEIAASGHSVALVDADPYGGAIAPSLGLLDEAPGFASACRLAGGDALDRVELERIAQCYSARGRRSTCSPVWWVRVGGPSSRASASPPRFQAIGARSEYVVVDTGFSLERDEELTSDQFAPRRNAATFAVPRRGRPLSPWSDWPTRRALPPAARPRRPRRPRRARARRRDRESGPHGRARHRRPCAGAPDAPRFAGIADATLLPHDGRATDAAILTARTCATPPRAAPPRGPPRVRARPHPARSPAGAAARVRLRPHAAGSRELRARHPDRRPHVPRHPSAADPSRHPERCPRVAHYAGSCVDPQ
jgi:hypothetical protein